MRGIDRRCRCDLHLGDNVLAEGDRNSFLDNGSNSSCFDFDGKLVREAIRGGFRVWGGRLSLLGDRGRRAP